MGSNAVAHWFVYFYHGWLLPSSLGLLPTLAMRAHATRLSLIIIIIIIIIIICDLYCQEEKTKRFTRKPHLFNTGDYMDDIDES